MASLKQAPRGPGLRNFARFSLLHFRKRVPFSQNKSRADYSMFVRRRHGRCLILLLYVDDNIITGNDSSLLFDFIKEPGNQFVSFIRCITFSAWRYLAPPLDFA